MNHLVKPTYDAKSLYDLGVMAIEMPGYNTLRTVGEFRDAILTNNRSNAFQILSEAANKMRDYRPTSKALEEQMITVDDVVKEILGINISNL